MKARAWRLCGAESVVFALGIALFVSCASAETVFVQDREVFVRDANYDTSAIGRDLGYVRRSQSHGISAYDWRWTLDFADGVFVK